MINKKTINKIGIYSFITFLLLGMTISILKCIRLEKSHLFTVGVLYKTNMGGTGVSPTAYYKYSVNNKSIDMTASFSSNEKFIIGDRYFIRFEKGNPKNSEILLDKPVPDSITNLPKEGWIEIPGKGNTATNKGYK